MRRLSARAWRPVSGIQRPRRPIVRNVITASLKDDQADGSISELPWKVAELDGHFTEAVADPPIQLFMSSRVNDTAIMAHMCNYARAIFEDERVYHGRKGEAQVEAC